MNRFFLYRITDCLVPMGERNYHERLDLRCLAFRVLLVMISFAGFIGAPCLAQEHETVAKWREEHFSIHRVEPQKGWSGQTIVPEQWGPVAQPNLEEELQNAPKLELERVAPPPERCWTGHQPYLVPNLDGRSWDMVFPYYNTYRGEQEVVIHDFGTGKTRKQVLSTGKGDSVLTKEALGFHMQPSFYADGKLIFEMYGPVLFVIYDPAVNGFVHGEKPFGDNVINGRCVLGEDGIIYGVGWPRDKRGFVAYSFNPKTYEAERSETFGPPNPHRKELYREVKKSGHWFYAAIGSRPWHLVAYNFRTKKGRLLATTEDIRGGSGTIGMDRIKGGAMAQGQVCVSRLL